MRRLRSWWLFLLTLCVAPILAQGDSCPVIVNQVLENLDQICVNTGRNEACYGNISLEALAREGVSDFQFNDVGDIEGVADIGSLRLSPMDEGEGIWGVSLMRLQANLPDTLPGQNVTFLLFGDVELINAAGPDARPMQAFYLRTGVSEASCAEAPQDGMLVQTPEGRGEIVFSVNGVDIAIGSTAFLQAPQGQELKTVVLEGGGAVRCAGQIAPVLAGTQISCPLDPNTFTPSGPPSPLAPAEAPPSLPISLLDEEIEPAEPFNEVKLEFLSLLQQSEESPCGLSFLPDCDDLISALGGDNCPLDEAGEPDCDQEFEEFWVNNADPNTQPDFQGETVPDEPKLPPGCYPGICLQEPAEACKCALCGVACPAEAEPPPDQTTVDCVADPNNPACQQTNGGDGDNPPPPPPPPPPPDDPNDPVQPTAVPEPTVAPPATEPPCVDPITGGPCTGPPGT